MKTLKVHKDVAQMFNNLLGAAYGKNANTGAVMMWAGVIKDTAKGFTQVDWKAVESIVGHKQFTAAAVILSRF